MTRRGRADRPATARTAVLPATEAASALHQRGLAAARRGQLDPAIALFRQALAENPRLAGVHNDLGVALEATRRLDEAMAHYRAALALEPSLASAHYNLGRALQTLNQTDEAIAHYRHAIEATPNFVDAHVNLGVVLVALERWDDATACFRRALAIQPGNADANNNLGSMLARQQRWEEAIACFEQALVANPRHADAQKNLGNALSALGRRADAVLCYEKALAIAPADAETCTRMANALLALRREPEALVCYERALAIDPRHADAYRNFSSALLAVGRLDDARRAIETAVALAPEQLEYYTVLADCRRFTADDPHLATMKVLAQNLGTQPERDQISLHFALAKAYEDIGEHARSFDHLLMANAIKRRDVVYDEAATMDRFDRLRAVFTDTLMRRQAGLGDASSVPVFVFGMPRSGTTLVEQILASHPEVFGAGEIEDFRNLVANLRGPGGTPLAYPEVAATMTGAQLRELGATYVEALRAVAPTATRITDKLPFNFTCVGLIHLVLPHARLIHVRRNPVDTCLSCFSKQFVGDQPYSYDLAELGRYYRAYESVMAHWRRVLPPGVMLEVQYEDVVDDLEREARRLIAHCGLAWDDACLAFHTTQRPVRTASVSQVRQPIYRSSVARWKPYEALLTPLLAALGEPS